MSFDARTAKLLQPGQHLTIDDCPGLRLQAGKSSRTWTYRYKSPVDGLMRQLGFGGWPALSYHAAVAEWEKLRRKRDSGIDLALERRRARAELLSPAVAASSPTVRRVCDIYVDGHVKKNRTEKGRLEVIRTFATMLGDLADVEASSVTRKVAFAHIKQFDHIPVQASVLRRELGAAWDYCLDSGDLPDDTPNWWRQILRGKLKSQGHAYKGVKSGVKKRTLPPSECATLIRWLPNFSRNVNDFLTLYLWTMARGAEIEKMEGCEVQETAGVLWWTVPKAKTKNARRQEADDLRVPLVGRAEIVVRRRKEAYGDGFLFPSDSKLGYFPQKSVGVAIHYHMPYSTTSPKKARLRLPVTRWAPHDLRRTSRTYVASMGCPADVGEVLMGHVLAGVEGVYNRYTYDKEKLEWLTKLSTYLESLVAPEV